MGSLRSTSPNRVIAHPVGFRLVPGDVTNEAMHKVTLEDKAGCEMPDGNPYALVGLSHSA